MEAKIAICLTKAQQHYQTALHASNDFRIAIQSQCGRRELPVITYDPIKNMVIKYPTDKNTIKTITADLEEKLKEKEKILTGLNEEAILKFLTKPIGMTVPRFIKLLYPELADDVVRDKADLIVAPFKQYSFKIASTPEEYCTAFTASQSCMHFNPYHEEFKTYWNVNTFSHLGIHACLWYYDCPDLGIAYTETRPGKADTRVTLRKINGKWGFHNYLYGYGTSAFVKLKDNLVAAGYVDLKYDRFPILNSYEVPGRKVVYGKQKLVVLPLAHDDFFTRQGHVTYNKSRNAFILRAANKSLYSYQYEGFMKSTDAHEIVE